MIQKFRDPNIINLEDQVYSKLKELYKDDIEPTIIKNKTKFVSFEDAIKELAEIKKNSIKLF
jgi:hypothetical protein